jgi:poly(3-hydroxybutyrate) depolymerase
VWTDYAYDDTGADGDDVGGGDAPYPGGSSNAADLIQLQVTVDGRDLRIRAILETLLDADVPELLVTVGGRPVSAPPTVDVVGNTIDVVAAGAARGSHVDITAAVALASTGAVYDLGLLRAEDPCTMPDLEPVACVTDADNQWQDIRQADAIAAGQRPAATIDIVKMRQRATELPSLAARGFFTLLHHSDLALGEGIITLAGQVVHAGAYQPYLVRRPRSSGPLPAIVYLHGGGGNHLSGAVMQFPHFDVDALLVFPFGRSPHLGYGGIDAAGLTRPENAYGEQEVLDVLADVETRLPVDRDRVLLAGLSNGGVGAFHLAEFHPDRFTGVLPIVAGDAGILPIHHHEMGLLENLANLPVRMANGLLDPLAQVEASQSTAAQMRRSGIIDFRSWLAARRHHTNGIPPDEHEWQRGLVDCVMADLLSRPRVLDPARVVYGVHPDFEVSDPETGLDVAHTGAYWVSDLVLRGDDPGRVDVTSLARADRSIVTENVFDVGENVTAGADYCGPNPDVRTNDAWTVSGVRLGPGEPQPVTNGVVVKVSGFGHAALDLARMGIDVTDPVAVTVTTDGPVVLDLLGRGTVELTAGTHDLEV